MVEDKMNFEALFDFELSSESIADLYNLLTELEGLRKKYSLKNFRFTVSEIRKDIKFEGKYGNVPED